MSIGQIGSELNKAATDLSTQDCHRALTSQIEPLWLRTLAKPLSKKTVKFFSAKASFVFPAKTICLPILSSPFFEFGAKKVSGDVFQGGGRERSNPFFYFFATYSDFCQTALSPHLNSNETKL